MIRLIVLIVWILATIFFGIESKYSFLIGAVCLVLTAVLMLFGISGFALRMTTYAFGFFLIGTVNYLVEIKKNEKVE